MEAGFVHGIAEQAGFAVYQGQAVEGTSLVQLLFAIQTP
jgi:hypothetical protein